MTLFLADIDIPIEAISVLVLMLLSFIGWLKDKFFTKQEEAPDWEDEEMREVIWRRQTGQDEPPPLPSRPEPVATPAPPPLPPKTIRFDQPKQPAAVRQAPPEPPTPRELSERELQLANAFEQTMPARRRRTGHRREIDRLLRSPSSAKHAILLTEILGPPLGLRGESKS
ncbi:MAG: hypothetical protein AAGB14_04700 [Verrucomicrobiota bacterium]